ncbi:MAG TPA: hypothetical protein VGN48_06885 [Pedococcus sp.]|nr:hypothetical protein [Pedococcus sp.]
MPTTPNAGYRTANSVDDQFLALVLADEQLLRDEFDAIIAQQWATCPPPVRHRGASPAADPSPRQPLVPPGRAAARPRPRRPSASGRRRQRSPPNPTARGRGGPTAYPGAPHHQHARISG